jgi:hypothetical protein
MLFFVMTQVRRDFCSNSSLPSILIWVQSNLCTTATLGTPKKQPLFRGGRYSEVPPIKLVLIWEVLGSGLPLLTGGRCSEVVVKTGLTVLLNDNKIYFSQYGPNPEKIKIIQTKYPNNKIMIY